MNNQILTSTIIAIIYFLAKFIEMRFILKENKPLKHLVIDAMIVFISATATKALWRGRSDASPVLRSD